MVWTGYKNEPRPSPGPRSKWAILDSNTPPEPKQNPHVTDDGGAFSGAPNPKTDPAGLIDDPELRAFIRQVAEAIHRGATRATK